MKDLFSPANFGRNFSRMCGWNTLSGLGFFTWLWFSLRRQKNLSPETCLSLLSFTFGSSCWCDCPWSSRFLILGPYLFFTYFKNPKLCTKINQKSKNWLTGLQPYKSLFFVSPLFLLLRGCLTNYTAITSSGLLLSLSKVCRIRNVWARHHVTTWRSHIVTWWRLEESIITARADPPGTPSLFRKRLRHRRFQYIFLQKRGWGG